MSAAVGLLDAPPAEPPVVAHLVVRDGAEETVVICAAADDAETLARATVDPRRLAACLARPAADRLDALRGVYRASAVGPSVAAAATAMAAQAERSDSATPAVGGGPVFLFSGQGSQQPNMGLGLYRANPTFRAVVDRCAGLFDPHLPRPLVEVMFPSQEDADDIHSTLYTQPALFSLEVALASLWIESGVVPSVVLGHSIGELAAACVGRSLDLPAAVALVAKRASLMASLPRTGGMLSVAAAPDAVAAIVAAADCRIDIAAINGSASTVVSGTSAEIDRLAERLGGQEIAHERLAVSHAFHSSLMDPILGEFEGALSALTASPPVFPLVSNVTGRVLEPDTRMNARYFSAHLRGIVRFADGLDCVDRLGARTFLEIGPRATLCSLGRRHLGRGQRAWLPSLDSLGGDVRALLRAAAELFRRGTPVLFSRLAPGAV